LNIYAPLLFLRNPLVAEFSRLFLSTAQACQPPTAHAPGIDVRTASSFGLSHVPKCRDSPNVNSSHHQTAGKKCDGCNAVRMCNHKRPTK